MVVVDFKEQSGKAGFHINQRSRARLSYLSSSASDQIQFSRPVQTNTAKGITQRPSMLTAIVFFYSLSYICILPKQTRIMHPK